MDKATCKFYNGTHFNERCDAGVRYDDVTTDPDEQQGKALRKPCIDWDLWYSSKDGKPQPWDNEGQKEHWARRGHCDKRVVPSDEEISNAETESNQRMMKWSSDIKNNICPKHQIAIVKKQVGRCVYAEPCGCRLYQGTI